MIATTEMLQKLVPQIIARAMQEIRKLNERHLQRESQK
jgi:hypothetical protein